METVQNSVRIIKGGEFVIAQEESESIFFPEDATEDQKMIMESLSDFIDSEIKPKLPAIEKGEFSNTVSIIEKMGEMGFLGIHMPEEYGGMQMGTNTDIIVNELLGPLHSFNVSYSVQTGIGMLPFLFFGTESQKEKYLTKIISGDLKPAYCLTEPTSGSDALSAKAVAVLDETGENYILNGQKMWISNSGFADILIVFAKIDGEKFTAFIVDAHAEGVSLGEEEDKMGIHGSSTRMVFLEDVRVPVEDVLGDIGRGHIIAFNVLNIGRLKLGVLCISGSKTLIDYSVQYATDRIQFNVPISSFGAIKKKIAEQCIRTFAGESTLYRTSSSLEHKSKQLMESGSTYAEAKLKAAEEYAIECAILKVAGSEIIDYVADEAVQIYGGMGFSEETPVSRAYRDARINRIFEGTNEINRLLSINMLLRKSGKGEYDLTGPAWEVQKELTSFASPGKKNGYLAEESKSIQDFKKLFLMVSGGAVKKQMDGELNLEKEQQLILNTADILIDIYMAESFYLRVLEIKKKKIRHLEIYEAMLRVFMHDVNHRIMKNAIDAVTGYTSGDLLKTYTMGIKRFTSYPIQNVSKLRTTIADLAIAENKYPFRMN
ncbi:acyl-CoA dehydrogenase family protein [Membranicola marinus]|uniref:Acyl-CoA dehydrogenase family protein n=1 Tax=Membranihabitans marinus TaxID=1227546 RepID=A0A953LBW6_9BACT|nr:acyl-CoA dehydrogenase family protein [Membranihabitans marinus]MBY5957119.1 acyl-CoA dehydrogenase family protein [Membranihabitans marinus]